MEQEQLKQFTFYELYADILNSLNDVAQGSLQREFASTSLRTPSPTPL